MTFLPNGAAEEEENDSDEHEEEDEEEISIHGDVAVYLYQVLLYDNDTDVNNFIETKKLDINYV